MTSNGHILVTFGGLAEAQADTNAISQQITQELADLRRYLGPLTASWTGAASADFQALQARWDTSAADLNAVLQGMSAALGSALGNYQRAEQANAAMWR
ncbi:MAG: WXG100 family type VII secretion target [Actinomycetota bacterium]|nr:WXG100 family type VII secretion target [Actinomycetota bacterium]